MWTHNEKPMLSHKDFTDDVIGFIYRITYSDGRMYIGSKLIRAVRKLKPTKAQLAIRKNYSRKEMVDLSFVKYAGSSKNTKGLEIVSKEIIEVCSDKINLRYCETKHLFRNDVLCGELYLNDNINGTYFRNRITKGY